jgi:hypothetical protein
MQKCNNGPRSALTMGVWTSGSEKTISCFHAYPKIRNKFLPIRVGLSPLPKGKGAGGGGGGRKNLYWGKKRRGISANK